MKIRMPVTLKEQVEAAARAGNRSLNGEILLRLERSFEGGEDAADDDTAKRIATLEAELEDLRAEVRHQGQRLFAMEKKG